MSNETKILLSKPKQNELVNKSLSSSPINGKVLAKNITTKQIIISHAPITSLKLSNAADIIHPVTNEQSGMLKTSAKHDSFTPEQLAIYTAQSPNEHNTSGQASSFSFNPQPTKEQLSLKEETFNHAPSTPSQPGIYEKNDFSNDEITEIQTSNTDQTHTDNNAELSLDDASAKICEIDTQTSPIAEAKTSLTSLPAAPETFNQLMTSFNMDNASTLTPTTHTRESSNPAIEENINSPTPVNKWSDTLTKVINWLRDADKTPPVAPNKTIKRKEKHTLTPIINKHAIVKDATANTGLFDWLFGAGKIEKSSKVHTGKQRNKDLIHTSPGDRPSIEQPASHTNPKPAQIIENDAHPFSRAHSKAEQGSTVQRSIEHPRENANQTTVTSNATTAAIPASTTNMQPKSNNENRYGSSLASDVHPHIGLFDHSHEQSDATIVRQHNSNQPVNQTDNQVTQNNRQH
ncbi:MAG: hypothetical protein ACK4PR_04990 [Gammaproteobacteria bacterium]